MERTLKFKHRQHISKKRNDEEDRATSMVEHPGVGDRIVDVIVIVLVGLVAVCSVIPLWHVLMSSVSDGKTLLSHKGMVWWPVGGFTLKGYSHIFQDAEIVKGFFNSIVYTIAATALCWFISITAAYAMSRQTKLKKVMITVVMIPMLFGGGMLPTYMVIRALGWVATPLALIVPGCTNTMFIVMMMNAFNAVPAEMYEAARIDGAGHFRILFQVLSPLVRNMSAVIVLNSVMGQWNAWLQASIYVPNNRELWPLQLFVRELTSSNEDFLQTSNPDYSRYLIQYAVVIATSLPIIVAFPFFQKKLEKAVVAGGVKG